jgi:hypothetical protein
VLEAVAGSKKGKYLKLFFKHDTLHQKLNSLLVIPGLWEGMRIGLLHKVTAMHCDEVSLIGGPKPIGLISANRSTNTAYWMLLGIDLQHFFETGWRKRRAFTTGRWSHGRADSVSRP